MNVPDFWYFLRFRRSRNVSAVEPAGVTLFSVPWLKLLVSKILEFANLFNDLIYNDLEVSPSQY